MFHHLFIEDTLPWNRGSSSLLPTCASEKNCLNSTTSVTIIGAHLQHAHFMVDLIEGSGLPPGAFFDADGSIYFNASSFGLFSPINHARFEDSKAKFLADLRTLCKFPHSIRGQYGKFLSDTFLEYFSPVSVSPVLGPASNLHRWVHTNAHYERWRLSSQFEAAIEHLKIAAEREHSNGHSTHSMRDHRTIEVDNILSRSVDQFLADLSVAYHNLAADTRPIIGYFTDVYAYGESVHERAGHSDTSSG
ncbi:hypothetical protein ARMGADRAFT_1087315 [Armillaria gallica]|uniref:Uncharacterized protein n=1 Tax=Armillaria gallica TaxID=47427 RepID=A0A2H3DE57_ARMGA|nr:hypothetical protein ARMGADRAFT_1087315 [Armillaria gallica]